MTKIKVNSPTVADKVVRVLTQSGVSVVRKKNDLSADGEEGSIRLLLQQKLDEEKFDYDDDYVLVNGSSVWSHDRVMSELDRMKKKGGQLSGYLNKFLSINFDPADVRKYCAEKPTAESLTACMSDVPAWKPDVQRIVDDARNKYAGRCTA